jgi:hypothetical protein
MTRLLLSVVLISAFFLVGCETPFDVSVALETAPDLRVQVWDRYLDGPVKDALVTVYLPEGMTDGSHTGADGWTTQWLLVPRSAGRVQVSVGFYDRYGNPRTEYVWIGLEHGPTERRITISTFAP